MTNDPTRVPAGADTKRRIVPVGFGAVVLFCCALLLLPPATVARGQSPDQRLMQPLHPQPTEPRPGPPFISVAQPPDRGPQRTPVAIESVPAALAQPLSRLAAQAAVIFVGQVDSVDRQPTRGYVEVSFKVEKVLRGTAAGVYVLREWSGLWTQGQDRYHPGQQLLLLLRGRSASGFSSPVGGLDGVIPLLAVAEPPLLDRHGLPPADPGAAPGADSLSGARADLRWVATEALRAPVGGSVQTASEPASQIVSPGARLRLALLPEPPPDNLGAPAETWPGPVPPLPVTAAAGPTGQFLPGTSLNAVLALLATVPETSSNAR